MTEPQTVQEFSLPDLVMQGIRRVATDETASASDRVACVILAVLGYALYERENMIDMSKLKLAEPQWLEIAELLRCGVARDGEDGINPALTWLNQGPSCFKVEVVPS